jgi:hypothetical protein
VGEMESDFGGLYYGEKLCRVKEYVILEGFSSYLTENTS